MQQQNQQNPEGKKLGRIEENPTIRKLKSVVKFAKKLPPKKYWNPEKLFIWCTQYKSFRWMYAGIRIGASVGFTFFGLISPLASHLEFNIIRENSLTRKIYSPTTLVIGTLFNAGMGAFTGSLIGGGIALIGLKVTQKDEEIEEKFVRGSKFAILPEAQALISLQEKKKHYPRIRIGKLQMASTNDYGGYLLIGKPGTGKSLVLREIVEVLHERILAGHRVRAIVLDSNGDFISTHYRADFDLIFNPDDARSIKWSHSCEPESTYRNSAHPPPTPAPHTSDLFLASSALLDLQAVGL